MEPFQTRSADTAIPYAQRAGYRYKFHVWWCIPCLKAKAEKEGWPRCDACNGFGRVGETIRDKIIQTDCRPCNGIGFIPLQKKSSGRPQPWEQEHRHVPSWIKQHHVEVLAYFHTHKYAVIGMEYKDSPKQGKPGWFSYSAPEDTPEHIIKSHATTIYALGLPGGTTRWSLPNAPKINRQKIESLVSGGFLRPRTEGKYSEWVLSANGKRVLLAYGHQVDAAEIA